MPRLRSAGVTRSPDGWGRATTPLSAGRGRLKAFRTNQVLKRHLRRVGGRRLRDGGKRVRGLAYGARLGPAVFLGGAVPGFERQGGPDPLVDAARDCLGAAE